ncbi:hypothetical protein [Abyssisolibacter fermentans]|uniref:hypothetical protein n=1 Tax=Abyssisolibacter fermentans TaxID=1766203 RepID=UPI00083176DB|nr:hypothetical protein [Abyssisolibacter fermentans]
MKLNIKKICIISIVLVLAMYVTLDFQIFIKSIERSIISEMGNLRNIVIKLDEEIIVNEGEKVLLSKEQCHYLIEIHNGARDIWRSLNKYNRKKKAIDKEIEEISDCLYDMMDLIFDIISKEEGHILTYSEYQKLKEIEVLFKDSYLQKDSFGISVGLFEINFSRESYNVFKKIEYILNSNIN